MVCQQYLRDSMKRMLKSGCGYYLSGIPSRDSNDPSSGPGISDSNNAANHYDVQYLSCIMMVCSIVRIRGSETTRMPPDSPGQSSGPPTRAGHEERKDRSGPS